MLTRRRVPVLLLALCLAGCANSAGTGGPQAAAPASSSPPSPSVPAVVASDPPTVESTGKPAKGDTQTITGRVAAGVEPGCLLLADSTGSYLLIFDDPAMRSAAGEGAKVTLVGRPEPGMMSTCQQGIPFRVSAVQAN